MTTTVMPDGPNDPLPGLRAGENVLAMLCVSYSNRDPSGRALPWLHDWVRTHGATLWVQCYAHQMIGSTVRAGTLTPSNLPSGQVSELTNALRSVFRREQVLPDAVPLHRLVLVHNAQESTNDLATRARAWAQLPVSLLVTQLEWRWRVETQARSMSVPVIDVDGLRQTVETMHLRQAVEDVGEVSVARARARL